MTLTPQLVYNNLHPLDRNRGRDGTLAMLRRLSTDFDQLGHGNVVHDCKSGVSVLV